MDAQRRSLDPAPAWDGDLGRMGLNLTQEKASGKGQVLRQRVGLCISQGAMSKGLGCGCGDLHSWEWDLGAEMSSRCLPESTQQLGW